MHQVPQEVQQSVRPPTLSEPSLSAQSGLCGPVFLFACLPLPLISPNSAQCRTLCLTDSPGYSHSDLLTRHEATHDRDAGKSKSFIRRSDRAAQACEACASAKAKCDDQKPCGRCRAKKLACQASTRRSYQYKTSTEGRSRLPPLHPADMCCCVTAMTAFADPFLGTGDSPPSDSATVASAMANNVPPAQMPMHEAMEPTPFMPDVMGQNSSLIDPISDDMVYFNPMSNFLQDMDFTMSWDMNFDAFSIPQFDLQGPSPQSSTANAVTRPSPRNTVRDSSRGHSAFKRSPWLWDPKKEDYVQQQKEGLHIDEQSISQSPAFGKLMDRPSRRLKMTAHQRDRIFSIVLAQNKDPSKVPSFPTLDLLNYLLQAHFVQDEHQFDSWIHPASFDPENALPELLAAIISSGASFISVPAIWQFGLAMHEVVRLGVSDLVSLLTQTNRGRTSDTDLNVIVREAQCSYQESERLANVHAYLGRGDLEWVQAQNGDSREFLATSLNGQYIPNTSRRRPC